MLKNGLSNYLSKTREEVLISDKPLRKLFESEVLNAASGIQLSYFIADKAPLFYREVPKIVESIQADQTFLSIINETLSKLPTSETFQESHFGEILAGLFVEDVLGYRRIYSKLTLLTAENANAFKMDVVTYEPGSDPVNFIFCEVKTSMKQVSDGMPPGHDKSCYHSLFNSLRTYSGIDLKFDLTAIKDRLHELPPEDRSRVRDALKPYAPRNVVYIGLAIIDTGTKVDSETKVLLERRCKTKFSGELVGVADLKKNVRSVFDLLLGIKSSVQPR